MSGAVGPPLAAASVLDHLDAPGAVRIFVHGVTSLDHLSPIAALRPGLDAYAERALLLAAPRDIVCVAEPVDASYLDFLARLGIGVPAENLVVAAAGEGVSLAAALGADADALGSIAERVAPGARVILHPFIVTNTEFALAARLSELLRSSVEVLGGVPDAVRRANHKHVLRAAALELGIPVAAGEVVELACRRGGDPLDISPLRAAITRHIGAPGRVIVRGACGISGSATWIVERTRGSREFVLEQIATRTDNRVYLVEQMLEVSVSPNLQMFIPSLAGEIAFLGASDQHWEGTLAHGGNVYPSRATTLPTMIAYATRLSEWLRRMGFTGLVGFDFCECRRARTGATTTFFAEANPRINGATYPLGVMDRLNRLQEISRRPAIRAFVTGTVRTAARCFADFSASHGVEYFDPSTGSGVIPYNVGCLKYGRLSAAVLGGSRNEVMEVLRRLTARARARSAAAVSASRTVHPAGGAT